MTWRILNSVSNFLFYRRDLPRFLASLVLASSSLGIFYLNKAQALTFKFNASEDIAPEALAGFEAAGKLWSSALQDDVTVNINIGFQRLDEGVLGETESQVVDFSYSRVKTALTNDRTSATDRTAVSYLPQDSYITFIGTEEEGFLELDPDEFGSPSRDNTHLSINTANAKALGLINDPNQIDGSVTFNSNFDFDFDRSNGIGRNQYDFIGLAAHEIGHALGFVTGVDLVDIASFPNGPFAPLDLDDTAVFSALDLYRYSEDSVASADTSGKPVLDLAAEPGSPYFSIDGGRTNLGLLSTGSFNGDGYQASHWKDDSLLGTGTSLGLMDPATPPGETLQLTELDLTAFDAIGWDRVAEPVPEPSTIVGSVCATLAVAHSLQRRRRKKAGKTRK
jgi:hypothetical protein